MTGCRQCGSPILRDGLCYRCHQYRLGWDDPPAEGWFDRALPWIGVVLAVAAFAWFAAKLAGVMLP